MTVDQFQKHAFDGFELLLSVLHEFRLGSFSFSVFLSVSHTELIEDKFVLLIEKQLSVFLLFSLFICHQIRDIVIVVVIMAAYYI